MKKLSLLFAIGLFLNTAGLAQPTITHNTHGHQIGDVVEWWNSTIPADTSYPGPSGEDVLWNFTQYVSTNSFTNEYVDPANTPFAALASGSNLAVYHNIVNNDAYTFCNMSNQSMKHTGGGWIETGMQLFYDFNDPVTIQAFPFSFEDEYSDGYSYTIDYNQLGYDMVVTISGTITVIGDAWGDIQTPLGFYSDVLRVKETYTEVVSTYIEGQLISTTAIVEYFFKWFAPNRRAAVYEYHFIAGEEDSHAILYSDNSVGIETESSLEVQVFPNPASHYLRIKLSNAENVLSMCLVNSLGQVAKQIEPLREEGQQISVALDGLMGGLYFLNIMTEEGAEINHKVLIRQ